MREKIFNTLGLGLLALCFIVSVARILLGNSPKEQGAAKDGAEPVTIRFAHWQLENGPRDAFDRIAEEYTKLHPNVRVIPMAIPERIYTNWLVTQLVGETAPDLIEIGMGATEERVARFFTPLADLASSPNPYNRGTDLEGVPLRDTFFDGMEGGYQANLFQYYGVPISGFTVRMFYNLDLLKTVTGSEKLPATYEELVALCRKVEEYNARNHRSITPIAGSKYNGPILMTRLFSSQTQTLSEELSPLGKVDADAVQRINDYMEGKWSLDSEAVRSGFDLMREVGQFMQPGFFQLQRDDATLLFVQKRALMICTGSWDATSIRQQAAFRVGVGQIPFPAKSNPQFGKYTRGALSEAGANAGLSFGLTRHSKHPEIARDFLLFLASRPINELWSKTSGWLPAVVGINVNPDVDPFLPITDGALPGFVPNFPGMADAERIYTNSMHRLFDPFGGTEAFVELIKPNYGKALLSDIERQRRTVLDTVQRSDTQLAALAALAARHPGEVEYQQRLEDFMQSAAVNEQKYLQIRMLIKKTSKTLP